MKAKYKYIIALSLLLGFSFNFAHSELGFMTPEGDTTHYAHDFCQLTIAPGVRIAVTADSFVQKYIQPFLSIVCILPETAPVLSSLALWQAANTSPGNGSSSDTPLFVINRTLLI